MVHYSLCSYYCYVLTKPRGKSARTHSQNTVEPFCLINICFTWEFYVCGVCYVFVIVPDNILVSIHTGPVFRG
jgi:hypothetical protein